MLGQNDVMIKTAGPKEYIDEKGDSKIKDFFEHVIRTTEQILSQSSFGSDDCYVSEVLTHVDLLERTIRLPDQLATIVTDETDEKRVHDLRMVFPELLEKILLHFWKQYNKAIQCYLSRLSVAKEWTPR